MLIQDKAEFPLKNKNGVDALATDPVDPDRVYLATGTYTNEWDTNGQIMRSADRGKTWESTSLPFKVGGNMPGRSMGERLVIDPNKNNILYFGARSGNMEFSTLVQMVVLILQKPELLVCL